MTTIANVVWEVLEDVVPEEVICTCMDYVGPDDPSVLDCMHEMLDDALPEELVHICVAYAIPQIVPYTCDEVQQLKKDDIKHMIIPGHVNVLDGGYLPNRNHIVYIIDDDEESYNMYMIYWDDFFGMDDIIRKGRAEITFDEFNSSRVFN